jgi:hypothetical protein
MGNGSTLVPPPVFPIEQPIIWGQSGTNGVSQEVFVRGLLCESRADEKHFASKQHAFYQLIHQGTKLIPW